MAISLDINGQTYEYPETGDVAWGPDATDWAVAVTNGMLQKAGGLFQLLAETDFGSGYGIKSLYFKSRTTNPAAAGQIRLGNTDTISWRNAANDADLALKANASDLLEYDGNPIVTLALGAADTVLKMNSSGTAYEYGKITNDNVDAAAAIVYSKLNLAGSIVNNDISNSAAIAYSKLALTASIVNADISASAAIAYSKLALTGSIVNADISASAAIAFSKLATLSSGNILVGSAGNVATSVAVTGDVTISNAGVTAIATGVIVNADINAAAAIALTKLAATTASRAVVSDGSGFLVPATTTATEIGYVNGVTSAIQTQIDTKAPKANPTFSGTVLLQNASGAQPVLALSEDPDNGTDTVSIQAPASLASSYTLTLPVDDGTANQFLQTDGSGVLAWGSPGTTIRPNIRATEGSGTTTLTSSDNFWQIFDLSAGRTLVLPTTGISQGDVFTIENRANFLLTIQASNGSEITTSAGASGNVGTASIFKGLVKLIAIQNTPTTPAHWLTIECQEEGQYTPTLTNGSNVQASTAYSTNFTRNNSMVIVSGRVDIDATSSGFTLTVLDISLPKASNLTTQQQLSGTSTTSDSGVSMGPGFILGSTANDRAVLQYNSTTSINKETWFQFMYVMV